MDKRNTDSAYVKKYAAKRQAKSIKAGDMYLDDPVEAHIYQSWINEKDKKQLFIKLYSEYLANKPG